MHTKTTTVLTISLLTAAGLATSAWGEPQQRNRSATLRPQGVQDRAATTPDARGKPGQDSPIQVYDFHRVSSLMGSNVENHAGESIASIEDFVLERGSGQVEQVLLKTGDILGLGGKTVAVPYNQFTFNRADDKLAVDMTPEQLERASKFVPKNWTELDRNAWNSPAEDWLNNLFSNDADRPDDAFSSELANAKREPIHGEVLAVRRDWAQGAEQIVLVVDTKDGETQSLILGPSWYVMGQEHVPQRGDTIQGDMLVFPSPNGERSALIAATFNGERLTLRNADGKARWTTSPSAEPVTTRRYVLMSSLLGAKAKVLGRDNAGEIQDAVLELGSGQVALLGFDPNTNVLGLGDDIKCVPWQAANLTGDDEIRIDATEGMMQRSESLPDDVTVYSVPNRLFPVYTAFELEPAAFHQTYPNRAESTLGYDGHARERLAAPLDAWATDAPLVKALTTGEPASITGEVTAIRTIAIGNNESRARALVISADGNDHTVILGPARYFAHNDLNVEKGARVTVEGWKSIIDGHEYLAARTVDTHDGTIALFDQDTKPIWNTN